MKITVKELKALIREAVAEQYGYRGRGMGSEDRPRHSGEEEYEPQGNLDSDELSPEEWAEYLAAAED